MCNNLISKSSWWWLINSLSGSSVMLFQTRRPSGLLEPCCPSLLGDLNALSSCTVIRVATLRVECSRKCMTTEDC